MFGVRAGGGTTPPDRSMGWLKSSIFTWLGALALALYATDKWVTATLFVTGITAFAILDHTKRRYWEKLGIFTAEKSVPIFGHLLESMDNNVLVWEPTDKLYRKHKDKKYIGNYLLWSPTLLVTDPEIAKAITIKDFDHFVDRRNTGMTEADKWCEDMLVFAEGARWKGIRSVLSPTFSSGKMKNMFPLVMEKADALMKKLHKTIGNEESTVDMKVYLGRLTVDVIGTCAFGLEIDCIGDETAEFERKLAKAANQGMEIMFEMFLAAVSPKLADYFACTPMARWRYFRDVMVHSIEQRKNQQIKRNDFVNLVLEAQASHQADPESTKVEITEDTIIASAVVFLLAGYDTILNDMLVFTRRIAQNPEEQEKLREELREIVEKDGSLNYQNVMEAKYLEAAIMESQRMVPAGFILERKCTKDYLLPGTNITLEKGRYVQVPVWSLHNDEKYWEEPSKFNPDRFLPENREKIVHGTYMPFGLGPRNCIAQRFALMELKITIARLIQEFKLSLAPGFEDIGLKKGMMMRPEDTIPLVLTSIPEE